MIVSNTTGRCWTKSCKSKCFGVAVNSLKLIMAFLSNRILKLLRKFLTDDIVRLSVPTACMENFVYKLLIENKRVMSGGSMLSRFLVFLLSSFLLISFVSTNTAGAEDTDVQLFKVQLAVAKKGNPRAQYYLGEMHEQGLGTKQDVDEAFKWYNKAAEKGDPLAQRKLALREEIVTEIKKEQEAERVKAITAPAKTAIIEKSEKQEKPAKTVITGIPEKQESQAKPEIPVKPADKGKSGPESVSVAVVDKTEAEREIARIRAERKEQRHAAVRKMLRDMQKNAPGELFE